MIIKTLTVGPLTTNCYIVTCPETRQALVIDPGGDAPLILSSLQQLKATVRYIVNTHGHFDHVLADKELKEATAAPLAIHRLDVPLLQSAAANAALFTGNQYAECPAPDLFLEEGDTLKVGTLTLQVLFTPGHTPGHISLHIAGSVFVGDVLFNHGIGRTDLPGGNQEQLLQSIVQKLFPLGDATRVYPGHGPSTTIGQERLSNPWL
ncbi:MAG: MBL fold metallo-hydrolase [Chloroflexi bacterium]|nr:MBL fold metallo-hydrolase [Chloroflexota bacterium]MCL5074084.1 MBL fold metallo-hydrolase [Chloroflexota bacterium]